MAIKLEDLIPKNTNVFGARTPTYLEGLISPEQMKQAQQQSLFQGLLGTAIGYLAQPKNQGYGSAIPYLAKGYMQGMEMAQTPYSNLEKDVLMKEKFGEIAREKETRAQKQKLTEELLKDPTIANDPLLKSMAYNAPEKVYEQRNKTYTLSEGQVVKDAQGKVIATNPKEQKAIPFKDLYSTPQKDSRYGLVYFPNDPAYPVLDMKGQPIKNYVPEPKETTASTPAIPTDISIKNTKNRLNAAHNFDLDIEKEDDKTIAMAVNSRANQIMATKKVSFDDAIDMAVSEFEQAGSVTTTKPFLGFGGGVKEIEPKKTIKKIKSLSDFD